jgi:DNA-binding transcriptional LysR family regulator
MHAVQALRAARAKHPGLSAEVSGDYRTVDLAKGESDIALRAFRPTEPDLVARKLADTGWSVYASPAYAKARGLPRTKDDLPAHLLILYPITMHTVGAFKWMDDHKGNATDLVRVDNIEAAMSVISSGGGLGVLPAFITRDTGLVRVFEEAVFVNSTHCVYHESSRNTARVRAAADALASYFEANAAAFSTGIFPAGST